MAGAVFGELERHSEGVEKIEFCEAVFICDFGNDIREAGAALRMPRAHFSWQAQYFVDLDKQVPKT